MTNTNSIPTQTDPHLGALTRPAAPPARAGAVAGTAREELHRAVVGRPSGGAATQ